MLTKRQLAAFWRLWARAEAQEMLSREPQSIRDAYRRNFIFRITGKHSIKDLNPTKDYENIMYEVACLASDYQAMIYWSIALERRTAFMIGECARQIGEIVGDPHGWDYCRSVFNQANLPKDWMDIPDNLLHKVFQMLDTHRRRLLKKDNSAPGIPLGFNPTRTYYRSKDGLLMYAPHGHKSACNATA